MIPEPITVGDLYEWTDAADAEPGTLVSVRSIYVDERGDAKLNVEDAGERESVPAASFYEAVEAGRLARVEAGEALA